MPRLLLSLFLLVLISPGCSVYKSQGRKSFETETPARVPISVTFQCRRTISPDETPQLISLDQLKRFPGLLFRPTIFQETVILLVSSPQTQHLCISESLDLEEYYKNQDIFASQLNTWP